MKPERHSKHRSSSLLMGLALVLSTISFPTRASEKDHDTEIRESMLVMSRQLGVTCIYCHDLNNLKAANKNEFQIAKLHMKIVNLLNGSQGFGGKPKADCFMCHRGAAKYSFSEGKSR